MENQLKWWAVWVRLQTCMPLMPMLPVSAPHFQIQRIGFAHDDAYVMAAGKLPSALDASSGTLYFTTSTSVVCIRPVEAEKQVDKNFPLKHLFVI